MTDLTSINADKLPDPGEVPVLDWLDKNLIDVDPLYQRPLDEARVNKILSGFTWSSFGAVVVVPQEDGRYHVSDGQHRLAAAKLHPKVAHVPAVVVKVEDVPAEAAVFVQINKARKNVSPLELFFAQLAAGDADAVTVLQVCERAGVRIPKHPGSFKPSDCIAVNALHALVGQVGAMRAREYLQVLVAAGFAPIKAEHVKALLHLMTDPEFAEHVQLEDVAVAVRTVGSTGDAEAKRFAATHGTSVWKGLASVWFQKTKKRRVPVASAAQSRSASQPHAAGTGRPSEDSAAQSRRASVAPAAAARSAAEIAAAKAIPADLTSLVRPEIAARAAKVAARATVTASIAGDPGPGRSALDQRRASA